MSGDLLHVIEATLTRRELRSGAFAFRQGVLDDCSLFVVVSGFVVVGDLDREGREPQRLVGPGEVFGELAAFDPSARLRSAWSPRHAVVGVLSQAALRSLLTSTVEAALTATRLLAGWARQSLAESLREESLDVTARVARALLQIEALVHADDGGAVRHGMSQLEIAHLVGSGRESTNRSYRQLVSAGLVTTGIGWFRVEDRVALASRAGAGQ